MMLDDADFLLLMLMIFLIDGFSDLFSWPAAAAFR